MFSLAWRTQYLLVVLCVAVHSQNLDINKDVSTTMTVTPTQDDTLHNSTSAQVVSICEAFAIEFANAASSYTRCFLVNARPVHLCLQCVDDYLKLNKAYSELEQVGS